MGCRSDHLKSKSAKFRSRLKRKETGTSPLHNQKTLFIAAYCQGYEQGHNDTVESAYTDAESCALDFIHESDFPEWLSENAPVEICDREPIMGANKKYVYVNFMWGIRGDE
jgi:hypothetical protein